MGEAKRVAVAAIRIQKKCFVIGPIGTEQSPERDHSDKVLNHLVRKILKPEPFNYDVKRADEIDQPGVITHQIIENIKDADLIVADLSDRNPNVFYELSMCHIWEKPIVHLCREKEELPFDVEPLRVVFFDLQNLDSVEEAKLKIANHVKWLEDGNKVKTPIQYAQLLQGIRTGEEKDEKMFDLLSTILASLTHIRDRVESVAGWAEHEQEEERRRDPLGIRKGFGTVFETPYPFGRGSRGLGLDALRRPDEKPEKE